MVQESVLIAQAAGKAIGICALLYIVVVHLFVAWKWNTTPVTSLPPKAEPWYESQDYRYQQNRLEALVDSLQEEIDKAAVVQHQIQDLTRRVVQQQAAEKVQLFANVQQQDHAPVKHVKDLLSTQGSWDESFPMDALLKQSFKLATNDLRRNIQLANAADWKALKQALEVDVVAAIPTVEINTDNSSCDSLTQQDLNKRIDRVLQSLQQRWSPKTQKGIPLLFPETIQRLQEARDRQMEQTQERVLQQPSQTNREKPTTGACIHSSEDVIPWIEAGLDALYRHQSVRQAILQAVQNSNVNTTGLILDADLEPPSPPRTTSKTTSLRQILDRLPLHVVAAVVNTLTDYVSGYHDGLDQYLDSLGDNDVGRVAVQRILCAAGAVSVEKLPTKLREL